MFEKKSKLQKEKLKIFGDTPPLLHMYSCYVIRTKGARGGAVCWGTMLQAGGWRVRFPDGVTGIFY
jgi:hypothetical protein